MTDSTGKTRQKGKVLRPLMLLGVSEQKTGRAISIFSRHCIHSKNRQPEWGQPDRSF